MNGEDLALVERDVVEAIRSGDRSGLTLIGHGEVSIALGWPTVEPTTVVKRVPPFASSELARQYVGVCEDFLGVLHRAGVSVWPTTFHTVRRHDGRFVVYHSQPLAESGRLGNNLLRSLEPASTHPLIDAIVDAAVAVVTPTVGLDCQASNWVWDGTTASQIDFSSPFVLNDTRDDLRFDTPTFLREYPVLLRPYLRRELVKIIHRFTTPEGAIGDMVAQLMKERLDPWVDTVCRAAKDRHGLDVDPGTSRTMLAEDLKLLPLALRLKKAERWWRVHTGRSYEALLPDRTTYEAEIGHR